MKITKKQALAETPVHMEGAQDVCMSILVGPEHGSEAIIMRRFTVAPGGHTPYHTHDYEHLIHVLAGKGHVVNEAGDETGIAVGDSVFVVPGEKHQFRNPFDAPFVMTCTIPNPELKPCTG